MRRSIFFAVFLTSLALLVRIAAASADVFGPISMASDGFLAGEAGLQQALYAHDPAISGNGQYIAFDGYFAGLTGVWRRNLQTGEVQPVAVGAEVSGSEQETRPTCVGEEPCDAELPSISENGQYVSFTTTAPLAPENDGNKGPDVYVRNMNVPESQPCTEEQALHPAQSCAFTLVSAVNGKTEGLTYLTEAGFPALQYGSVAAGRSAMSANGQEVAFVTTAVSNLAACQLGAATMKDCEEHSPEPPEATTPALQVAVRNLATDETQLVSVEYEPSSGHAIPDKPVSVTEGDATFGAVFKQTVTQFPFHPRAYAPPPALGASISADGTTVAWLGDAVPQQAEMLPGERDTPAKYTEPLWRRIANGPLAPTRRVTGGSQPEDAACVESGQASVQGSTSLSDPCLGPFEVEGEYGVWTGKADYALPQLSADGYTVAFLATAQPVALGVDFGRAAEGEADDLYVANMYEGLTRSEALRTLTELASGNTGEVAGDAAIVDLAISPKGNQVAFSTQRTEFPLDSLDYVSQPAAVPGMAELFDVDLEDGTLTRVTVGYEGGPSELPHGSGLSGGEPYRDKPADGALSPSFSEDGGVLAFSSTASNLVYGDGNTPSKEPEGTSLDGGDAFFVSRKLFSPEPAETYVSGQSANPSVTPQWRLSVTAESLSNGSVRLYVELPGAGELSATADSAVRVSARHGRSSAKRGHASERVAKRKVASAKEASATSAGGLVQLTLTLTPSYRTLAGRSVGLSSTASLLFTAPGHPALRQSIAISFLRSARPARAKRASKRMTSKARHRR
jgi:hypothetical protein